MFVIFFFFFGSDVKSDNQAANTGTYSGYAFQPNLTFWWTRAEATADGSSDSVHISFGISWDTGSGIDNYSAAWGTRDGQAASIVNGKRHSTASTMDVSNNAEDWADAVATYESDGLTKNTDGGTTERLFSLSMNVSQSFKVALIDLPSDDTSAWTVTGVGFQPEVLGMVTSMVDTADSIETGTDAEALGFAMADFNESKTGSASMSDLDNDGANTVAKSHGDAQFLTLYNGSNTQEFDITALSADSDGWNATAGQNVKNNATARKAIYFAFGAAAPGVSPLPSPLNRKQYRSMLVR